MSAYPKTVTCVLLDIDGMQEFNDKHGRNSGDNLLLETMAALKKYFPIQCNITRLSGDEFLVIAEGESQKQLAECAQTTSEEVLKLFGVNITFGMGSGLTELEAKNFATTEMFNCRTRKQVYETHSR